MKNIIIIVLLAAFLPANEIYKQVRVYSDTEKTLSILQTSGLDIAPFRRIQALRQGQVFENPDEQKHVYEQLMATVRNAATLADQL